MITLFCNEVGISVVNGIKYLFEKYKNLDNTLHQVKMYDGNGKLISIDTRGIHPETGIPFESYTFLD